MSSSLAPFESDETVTLFHELLREKLRAKLKEDLMRVAEGHVDTLLDAAASEFETSVRAYISHIDRARVVDFVIKRVEK